MLTLQGGEAKEEGGTKVAYLLGGFQVPLSGNARATGEARDAWVSYPYIDAPHSPQPPQESQGPLGPANRTPSPEPTPMNKRGYTRPGA